MSGVAIARYLLANNLTLTAVVSASKIFAGTIPLNTELPAIGITQISGTQRTTVSMSDANRLVTERVQVTVAAKTYPLQKSLLSLVRESLPLSRGVVNSFDCDSIILDSEGPDIYDQGAEIYEQSQDFFIRFNR